jgi:hypothetical protein
MSKSAMNLNVSILLIVCVCTITPAFAAPVQNPANGHWYELVQSQQGFIDWAVARNAAATLNFNGMHGHLATITSQAENDFIFNTLSPPDNAWIGGERLPGQSDPKLGWVWITGEPFNYKNWATPPNDGDEPDDLAENCIYYESGDGSWDDEWCSGTDSDVSYYIVEYEPTVAIPTLTQWGMIIFMVIAGLASAYYLRRQRRDNS